MTDTELKTVETDASKIAADAKTDIKVDETKIVGYVKTHMVIISGLVGALFGFILGHLLR